MGVIVDLIEEIRDRLATAQASGDLTEVKAVRVSDNFEARKQQDFPLINIRLISGDTDHRNNALGFVEVIELEISLIHGKLASLSSNNNLYNTGDSTGFLFVFEKLLNVLEKNTSDVVDLGLNDTANNYSAFSYSIDNSFEDLIIGSIIVKAETSQFLAGGR